MTFKRLRRVLHFVARPLLGGLFAAGAVAPLSAQTCQDECLVSWAALGNCDDGGCDSFACEDAALFPGIHAARTSLTESGITFQNILTQFYIGNTSGGNDQAFRYSGHGDYVTNFDLGKLGVQEGLFLKIRAEHRFGASLRNISGSVLPTAIAAELPTAVDERLCISNFLLTQALSENFALFAGKMDTLDGDVNAYAHSRGINQFLNTAFVTNPIALRTVPYSTLGAGFVFLADGAPIFTFTVLNATDTVRTDGFSELFNEGAVVTAELRLPTNLLGMPGHHLFGGVGAAVRLLRWTRILELSCPTCPLRDKVDPGPCIGLVTRRSPAMKLTTGDILLERESRMMKLTQLRISYPADLAAPRHYFAAKTIRSASATTTQAPATRSLPSFKMCLGNLATGRASNCSTSPE